MLTEPDCEKAEMPEKKQENNKRPANRHILAKLCFTMDSGWSFFLLKCNMLCYHKIFSKPELPIIQPASAAHGFL
jgi:hypothetical protein